MACLLVLWISTLLQNSLWPLKKKICTLQGTVSCGTLLLLERNFFPSKLTGGLIESYQFTRMSPKQTLVTFNVTQEQLEIFRHASYFRVTFSGDWEDLLLSPYLSIVLFSICFSWLLTCFPKQTGLNILKGKIHILLQSFFIQIIFLLGL